MRLHRSGSVSRAFSLIELLCVIAMIGILAALLLPALTQARAGARRVQCVSNLRQVGVAFQAFAHDHNGQFPMAVPGSAGGSAELSQSARQAAPEFYFAFRHFQTLSNDLVTPKLLICPADTRLPAPNFGLLQNENVSYFVALASHYSEPTSILAGDRNLTNDLPAPSSLLILAPGRRLRWTQELHQFKGNLLYADGHVEEKNNILLRAALGQTPSQADLALPTPRSNRTATRSSATALSGASGLGASGPEAPVPVAAVQSPEAPRGGTAFPPPKSATPPSAGGVARGTMPGLSLPRTAPGSGSAPLEQTNPFPKRAEPPSQPSGVAPPPAQTEEPGFSLFPPWVAELAGGLVRKGAWLFYLLLLLVATAALYLRKKSRAKVKPAKKPGS